MNKLVVATGMGFNVPTIEQIKILYTNTNLPAALYGADGSVIWQNAAALHLAQLFPCEEWSAAAVRETAARIAGNSG